MVVLFLAEGEEGVGRTRDRNRGLKHTRQVLSTELHPSVPGKGTGSTDLNLRNHLQVLLYIKSALGY